MSDEFAGSDLSPKGEQLPGQNNGQMGVRVTQLYTVDPNWPCSACGHKHGDHKFLYGVGIRDRYRCQKPNCECGKQYMITAMVVDPTTIDTDEKREEFIKRHNEAREKEKRHFDQ